MRNNENDAPFKPARRAALVFSAFFVGLLLFVFLVALLHK
jgi:hypothetical protein